MATIIAAEARVTSDSDTSACPIPGVQGDVLVAFGGSGITMTGWTSLVTGGHAADWTVWTKIHGASETSIALTPITVIAVRGALAPVLADVSAISFFGGVSDVTSPAVIPSYSPGAGDLLLVAAASKGPSSPQTVTIGASTLPNFLSYISGPNNCLGWSYQTLPASPTGAITVSWSLRAASTDYTTGVAIGFHSTGGLSFMM